MSRPEPHEQFADAVDELLQDAIWAEARSGGATVFVETIPERSVSIDGVLEMAEDYGVEHTSGSVMESVTILRFVEEDDLVTDDGQQLGVQCGDGERRCAKLYECCRKAFLGFSS